MLNRPEKNEEHKSFFNDQELTDSLPEKPYEKLTSAKNTQQENNHQIQSPLDKRKEIANKRYQYYKSRPGSVSPVPFGSDPLSLLSENSHSASSENKEPVIPAKDPKSSYASENKEMDIPAEDQKNSFESEHVAALFKGQPQVVDKMPSDKAKLQIAESMQVNNQEASASFNRALYPLRSGKYLIKQYVHDQKTINFYLCDLGAKTSERIYQHEIKNIDDIQDRDEWYLPEGPVLKPINDAINIKREQLFQYRLAAKMPEYFQHAIGSYPLHTIAYIGDDHFIVANETLHFMTENMVFDVFSEEKEELTQIKQLKDNYTVLPNPFFSSFSNYKRYEVDQIFCASNDFLCIVHHDNHLDIWKKTNLDKFGLYASFYLKEKLKNGKFNLICIAQTSDNHLICQAIRPINSAYERGVYFLKIDLNKKKLVKMSLIDNPIFHEMSEMTPIKNSDLFIGRDYTRTPFLVDTESLSVQKLKLPEGLEYGAITEFGDIIAYDFTTIYRIPFPSLKAFLMHQKEQVDNARKPVLSEHIYPMDLVNIINSYTDDYDAKLAVSPVIEKKPQDEKESPAIGRFSYFYNERDMLQKPIQKPFEVEAESIILNRVFK